MDAVLNWLWQGSAVAMAWFMMLLALERSRANLRYLVCWVAALVIIALPALPSFQSAAVSSEVFGATHGDAIVPLPDVWWTSTLVMLAAWMLWTSIQMVRFFSAIGAIRRARARSRAFPSHLESALPHWRRVRSEGRRATLVWSDSVTTAAVLGWGAPMIAVAPSLARTLDADELDRVLIHEWAHVQRRDDLVNILQVVVRIVAGWHPALWWIVRRMHVEREIACDEMTVAITGSPRSYAECLMKLASVRRPPRALQTAPAMFTPSDLRARVIKIVSPHPSIAPVWSRTITAAIVSTLCVMSVALGGLRLVETTAIALPFVSPRAISITTDRLVPVAAPALPSDMKSERSRRRIVGWEPSSQRPKAEQPSPLSQATAAEPDASLMPDAANRGDSMSAAEADAERTVAAPATVPQTAAERSDVATEQPQSPWTAAAAGGTAIGRTSKAAGVAAAGFFSRFARRVAGSL